MMTRWQYYMNDHRQLFRKYHKTKEMYLYYPSHEEKDKWVKTIGFTYRTDGPYAGIRQGLRKCTYEEWVLEYL